MTVEKTVVVSVIEIDSVDVMVTVSLVEEVDDTVMVWVTSGAVAVTEEIAIGIVRQEHALEMRDGS